jgi:hypothetical protein
MSRVSGVRLASRLVGRACGSEATFLVLPCDVESWTPTGLATHDS